MFFQIGGITMEPWEVTMAKPREFTNGQHLNQQAILAMNDRGNNHPGAQGTGLGGNGDGKGGKVVW